jgi:hypothetical protein
MSCCLYWLVLGVPGARRLGRGVPRRNIVAGLHAELNGPLIVQFDGCVKPPLISALCRASRLNGPDSPVSKCPAHGQVLSDLAPRRWRVPSEFLKYFKLNADRIVERGLRSVSLADGSQPES